MDLLGGMFILAVACLIVVCIALGLGIGALIFLSKRDDRRLQVTSGDMTTPNRGQPESGEPNSRDIVNLVRNGFDRIQRENLINFRLTLIALGVAIMLASVVGRLEDIIWRLVLYGLGLVAIVAAILYRRVR